jgi:hypothetical protein
MGFVLLAIGVASSWLVRRPPIARTTHTSNPAPPKVEIAVPAGWRLEQHDEVPSTMAIRGTSPAPEAPTVLSVFTSHMEEDRDLDVLVSEVTTSFQKAGYSVNGKPFDSTVAGRQAKALVMQRVGEVMCMWNVKLTAHDATGIQCFSRDGADPREACAAVLAGLTWAAGR